MLIQFDSCSHATAVIAGAWRMPFLHFLAGFKFCNGPHGRFKHCTQGEEDRQNTMRCDRVPLSSHKHLSSSFTTLTAQYTSHFVGTNCEGTADASPVRMIKNLMTHESHAHLSTSMHVYAHQHWISAENGCWQMLSGQPWFVLLLPRWLLLSLAWQESVNDQISLSNVIWEPPFQWYLSLSLPFHSHFCASIQACAIIVQSMPTQTRSSSSLPDIFQKRN